MFQSTLLVAALAAATEIPVANFVAPPALEAMKLSPDGKHLALVVPQSEYETMLVVMDAKSLKPVGGLRSAQRRHIENVWWASDTRLVISTAEKYGSLDTPYATGHLEGVDFDGKRVRRLYGNDGEQQLGTRRKTRATETGFAYMVDPLPDMPEYAAIGLYSGKVNDPYPDLMLLNVVNGNSKQLAKAPVPSANFIVDRKGQPHFVAGTRDGWQELYQRVDEGWRLINKEAESHEELRPLHLAGDGKLYIHRLPASGPGQVELWDPASGQSEVLYQPSIAEPYGFSVSADGNKLTGVITADGRFSFEAFDKSAPEARAIAALSKSFPDALVHPIDYSRDGKTTLFRVGSDRNSGEYYLLEDGKARFLLARDEGLDPALMRPTEAISLKARDGRALHGYLTRPAGEAKAPLVVLPHGGPHGVRDYAEFDAEVQFLANRGFAVLQVNFRGSGGYGQEFATSGYGQWGGSMIDDLLDATRHVIELGHVDEKRICSYGASYGGFAALSMAVREPDLLRCAISYVGVSDLELMYSRGDISNSREGKDYLERVLGKDKALMAQYSPVNHADRIQAKVMLVHGGDDFRVPPVHAKRMKSELEKAGKTVEWLYKIDEGHGFYKREHREEFLSKLIEFLRANTGA